MLYSYIVCSSSTHTKLVLMENFVSFVLKNTVSLKHLKIKKVNIIAEFCLLFIALNSIYVFSYWWSIWQNWNLFPPMLLSCTYKTMKSCALHFGSCVLCWVTIITSLKNHHILKKEVKKSALDIWFKHSLIWRANTNMASKSSCHVCYIVTWYVVVCI
jgi:hypothetical protein